MKVVQDREVQDGAAKDEAVNEFVLCARLEIDSGEYRPVPSDCLLQALRRSFVRLTEALVGEFESLLGPEFHLVSLKEVDLREEERRFNTTVQLHVESTGEVVDALSSHLFVSGAEWVHTMGLAFPVLRGSTAVSVKHGVRVSVDSASGGDLERAA